MSGRDKQITVEKFNLFLRDKKLKPSKERLTILEEVMVTQGHFEADDLLAILKNKRVKTSRATIYRTLDLLEQSGILRKVYLGEKAIHFERISAGPRHDYMICNNCGVSCEFHHPELQALLKQLCDKYNFSMNDYCFQIFGLCSDCQEKVINSKKGIIDEDA